MSEMQELMEEILKRMQRKYKGLLEIERITKELAELLSAGDRESVQLLMNMREEEIESTGKEDLALRELLNAMDRDTRQYFANMMNGCFDSSAEDFLEKKICQLGEQTRNVCAKTVQLDKVLSMKVAGKESYYQK